MVMVFGSSAIMGSMGADYNRFLCIFNLHIYKRGKGKEKEIEMNKELTKKIASGSTKVSLWLSILTAVFAVLKLTHVISWSWLWVFSPMWIQFLLGVVIFLGALLFIATVNILLAIANKTEK
jgi:hypothetical protein